MVKRLRFLVLFLMLFVYRCPAQSIPNARLDSLEQLMSVDPVEADSFGQLLLEEMSAKEEVIYLPRLYYLLGITQYYLGKHLLAAKYYRDALEYIDPVQQSELEAAIWNNLGVVYELSEDFAEGIAAYLKSLDYALAQGDSLSIYQSYLNLGLMYTKTADYNTSEQYLKNAYRYFSREGDPYNTALASQNLGILFKTTGRNKEAQQNFKQALDLVGQLNNPQGLAGLYNDYMYFLLLIENYREFEAELPVFNQLLEGLDNDFLQAAATSTKGYFAYWAKKDYRQAIAYFLDAIEVFTEYGSVPQLEDMYPKLADCYYRLGQWELARQYQEKYELYLTNKYADESAAKIAELRTVHEVAQKEAQTAFLQLEVAQKTRRIRWWILIAISFIVASMVTGYLLWVVKRNEKVLVARSLELSALVDQQETLEEIRASETTQTIDQEDLNNLQFKKLFARIKQYVVQDKQFLDPNLKIMDIASALGTNERYVSQALSEGGNTSFSAFVNFYRINRAKHLLRSSDTLSIGEVASRSGFGNQSSFQRKFKEMTGVTPLTFQRLSALKPTDSEEE